MEIGGKTTCNAADYPVVGIPVQALAYICRQCFIWENEPKDDIDQKARATSEHEQYENDPDYGWIDTEIIGQSSTDAAQDLVVFRTVQPAGLFRGILIGALLLAVAGLLPAVGIRARPGAARGCSGQVFLFKIFGASHACNDGIYIRICNTGRSFFKGLREQLRKAVFNITDNLITAVFIGKIPAQAFNILLQYFISGLFDRDHPAMKVYIDDLFHV